MGRAGGGRGREGRGGGGEGKYEVLSFIPYTWATSGTSRVINGSLSSAVGKCRVHGYMQGEVG